MKRNRGVVGCTMNRATLAERIWWETDVPVFLEKLVLPFLATSIAVLIWTNPMKFDWPSRIALCIGLSAFAYVAAHQIHLRNEAIRLASQSVTQKDGATTSTATLPTPQKRTASTAAEHPQPERKKKTLQHPPLTKPQIGSDNTLVNVPIPPSLGDGNTFIGPTDANGNTIYNKGGTAIGKDACADPTSIAIGAGANAGCKTPAKPQDPTDASKPN